MGLGISHQLEKTAVGRTALKSWRLLNSPAALRSAAQVEADYWKTHRQVRGWAGNGHWPPPDKAALFISFTNLPVFAKFEGVLAANLRRYGYAPIVVTLDGAKRGQRYHRLFGISEIVGWETWSKRFAGAGDEGMDVARQLLSGPVDVQQFKQFQYKGIYVGRHALSRTARTQLSGRLNFGDSAARAELERQLLASVRNVDLAFDLFKQYKPAITFVRDPGYVPQGQLFEVGLATGADSIYYTFGQKQHTWIFKRYSFSNRDEHYFSLSDETWREALAAPWTEKHQAELDDEFKGRYEPESHLDTRRLQEGKRFKSPEEICQQLGLDPNRKTAVVFSHITWDEALFFGNDLFDDFEHWLLETTRVACRNRNLNWIIKLHPGNVIKLLDHQKSQTPSELMVLSQLGPLPDHVKVLPAETDINTRSLFPLIDYGLTVRGTIGLELPCFGIPVLLAGTGRYSGKGFTLDPTTREDYLRQLESLHLVPRLSQEQVLMAKKHAYVLFRNRQTSFQDICPMGASLGESAANPLHMNLSVQAGSVAKLVKSPSMNLLGDWLANNSSADLL
jgi:hypothetical protein